MNAHIFLFLDCFVTYFNKIIIFFIPVLHKFCSTYFSSSFISKHLYC